MFRKAPSGRVHWFHTAFIVTLVADLFDHCAAVWFFSALWAVAQRAIQICYFILSRLDFLAKVVVKVQRMTLNVTHNVIKEQ